MATGSTWRETDVKGERAQLQEVDDELLIGLEGSGELKSRGEHARGGLHSGDIGGEIPKQTSNGGSSETTQMFAAMTQMMQVVQESLRGRQMVQYQVLPDLSKSIDDFDGEDSGAEWFAALESAMSLHNWPEAVALEKARIHLKGGAEFWFRTHRADVTSWADFRYLFRRTFIREANLSELWTKMRGRVQKAGESVQMYFHEKYNRCTKLNLSFRETKEQILIGLVNRDVVGALLGKEHLDEVDLLRDVLEFERVQREISALRKGSEHRVAKENVRGTGSPERKKSPVKCFNCGKVGHISTKCTEPKAALKCFKCHEVGHVKARCPSNVDEKSAVKQDTVRAMTVDQAPEAGKEFRKSVTVNGGLKVNSLVDTGSSDCIMIASTAVLCGLRVTPCERDIFGFGSVNNAVAKTLGFANVTLAVDTVNIENVKVLIVPDVVQPVELLLGRSFTERTEIAYARKGETLRFGYCEEDPFKDLKLDMHTSDHSVRVKDDVTVPQNTVRFVNANIDCLRVYVPVVNATERDIVLAEGQVLARNVNGDSNDVCHQFRRPITRGDVVLGATVNDAESYQLLDLLNRYRGCFAFAMNELGCTKVMDMDIREVDGARPVSAKPYRATIGEREEMQQIVREWRENGIVTDTKSAYASPVLLVRKKSGEARMVVDYRRLNEQTVRQVFPLPHIEDLLDSLTGCTLFTTLDLAHGYLQVPLTIEAREKTAFITPDETGEFTRMVFGLRNAPYEFTRLMGLVLGPLLNKVAMCYIDDLLVPSTGWADMLERLEKVLEAVRAGGLTLKLTKCRFGEREVEYLGLRLSAGAVKPGRDKLRAVDEFPVPRSGHDVRRFMGLVGYFRRFVENFARKAAPLTKLTKKEEPFEWGCEQEAAFKTLKVDLTSEPVLQLYNPKAYTELHTDASALGLAGLLMQKSSADGRMHLVSCVSKKTSDCESRYHSSKLELMAIVWSLDRLRMYLLGIPVVVITDCQALIYMNTQRTKNSQIARWAGLLQEYDLEFKHRAGAQMAHADALSRAPVEPSADTDDGVIEKRLEVLITMSEEDYVMAIQYADPTLRQRIDRLREGEAVGGDSEYVIERGCLYRKEEGTGKMRYVVPKSMRKSIVVKFHDQMGHFALDRTVSRIRNKYWFGGMKRYVKHHIQRCPECVLTKIPGGRKAGFLHPIPMGRRPFDVVHVDHLGPFVKSRKGNSYILVAVDNLTKFVKLWAMRDTSTRNVLKALEDLIMEFGSPGRIISDRGTCFTSKKFEEFCREKGIQRTLTSTRHPQANGQVERVNRVIVPVIQATITEDEHCWDRSNPSIRRVQQNLNTAVNKTTGVTPFKLLYGYEPTMVDGELRRLTEPTEVDQVDTGVLREQVRERVEIEQRKWKDAYDKKHYDAQFDVGEVVFLKKPPTVTGESTKLQEKFRGPLVVVEKLPGNVYKVAQIRAEGERVYTTNAHVSSLKGFHGGGEDDSESEGEDSAEEDGALPSRAMALSECPSVSDLFGV